MTAPVDDLMSDLARVHSHSQRCLPNLRAPHLVARLTPEERQDGIDEDKFTQCYAWLDAEQWAISLTNETLFEKVMAMIDELQKNNIGPCEGTSELVDPKSCHIDKLHVELEASDDYLLIAPISVPLSSAHQSARSAKEKRMQDQQKNANTEVLVKDIREAMQ